MLGIMRKYKQSVVIKIVFVVIVLSFVGTIFLVWGEGGSKGMGSGGYAVKVNRQKISPEDYQRSYYRLRSIYEQLYGKSLSPEMEKQLGVKKMALDSLIDAELVRQEAKKMGISVTKDEVKAAIAAIPAFQKDGAFDFAQYEGTLRASRITASDFEASQKEELLNKKARQKIKDQASVSDDEALQAFKKQNEKIELQYVAYSPAELKGSVKLTEQELTSYLQGHQQEFKTPEQVSFAYLKIDPAKYVAKASATNEEMQSFYQKNIDRYQEKGGILPFEKVTDRVKADLLKSKAAQLAYEAAADAVNKNGKGGDLKGVAAALGATIQETPLFDATHAPAALAAEPALVKRAFGTKQGEITTPVETPQGMYVLKVTEKKPADVPPLAKIKAQVEARAAVDKAQELAKKKAEEALAQLAKGGAGLSTRTTAAFGFMPKGDIPGIGTSPELMEAAFALTKAAPAAKTPFKIGDSWYAVALKSRTEANAEQFKQTKDQLKQALLPKKQDEAITAWIKELRAKAKIEINQALKDDLDAK
jgi:peptidyl-prolyl cis-trans isomerase D